ncbi:MAG TPA: DUF1656 domain-containing protein [Methyloversatilis sp.]
MSPEIDLFGVYLTSVLVTGTTALAITLGLNRVLAILGAYRHVWHRALFEAALFVIVWALVLTLSPQVSS